MSESWTAIDEGADILSAPSNSCLYDIAGAVADKGWTASGDRSGVLTFYCYLLTNVNSRTPLPRDVLDLLMSAILFAEAVARFDRARADKDTLMRENPAIFGGSQRVRSLQAHRQVAGKAPACQKR